MDRIHWWWNRLQPRVSETGAVGQQPRVLHCLLMGHSLDVHGPVLDAMEQVLRARQAGQRQIHDRDGGCQCRSIHYTDRLADAGIEAPVGRVGDPWIYALAATILGLPSTARVS